MLRLLAATEKSAAGSNLLPALQQNQPQRILFSLPNEPVVGSANGEESAVCFQEVNK